MAYGGGEMNQIELLRHVADNLEAGRDAACGLLFRGQILTLASDSNLDAFAWGAPEAYTLAPRTHTVNSFVVPSPMDIEPEIGDLYFVSNLQMDEFDPRTTWDGDQMDAKRLSRGLCFTTKEAAQQNALAMLGRDPAKGVDGV